MDFFFLKNKISFDRNELSGSYGDIGTDLPLIIGMVMVCNLDPASSFIMFGIMQIITGLAYGIPMPVQPLKAMAILMITNKFSGSMLYAAGLTIGITMLLFTSSGLLKWLVNIIPRSVVRGIQFGLGINLALLALKDYIQSDGYIGYILAGVGFIIIVFLIGNRKYPPAIFVVLFGAVYALIFSMDIPLIIKQTGFALPKFNIPLQNDLIQGFLILAIPQIALSVSNSVIATKQTVKDLFPEKNLTVSKIGYTYSFMNLINPFFSGIPTCHGSGGIAGHYSFGGRTGGSVIIYGTLFLVIGLLFSGCFTEFVKVFPLPILGVILLFEALSLMSFIKDITNDRKCLMISFIVALISLSIPYGFAVGLVIGVFLDHYTKKEAFLRYFNGNKPDKCQ